MIAYSILFLGIGFLIVAFFNAHKLQSICIVKSVAIHGNQEEVFKMVKYLNNFPKWSPFLAQDPKQQIKITGTDGNIGAKYHWVGNQGKDVGFQVIKQINEPNTIVMECNIQKPFKAKPVFTYTFTPLEQNIQVQQMFHLKSGMVDAFFMWIFGVKKQMENTNEQGLSLLKKAIEE